MDDSALKTLIDNQEMLRTSLHSWLHFWTFLVVVGVALEVIFVIWEYAEDLHDFRRGIVHPPEKPSILLLVLGLLGAGLVAIGVAGELYVDVQAGKVETVIRGANERRVSLLSKEAGDAKTSSEVAASAASSAKGSADAASLAADKVKEKVEAVAKRAEEIDSQLALTQLLTSARHVENIKTLTEQLRQFKGQTIVLASYNADSEEYGLCFVLKSVTHDAGMNPIDECGMWNSNGPPATGVSVRGPDDNAVLSMAEMISRTGTLMVQSGPYGNAPKPATFVILVGPKPPFEIGQARGVKTPKKKPPNNQTAKP